MKAELKLYESSKIFPEWCLFSYMAVFHTPEHVKRMEDVKKKIKVIYNISYSVINNNVFNKLINHFYLF